jgi:hypothetical protein
MKFFKDSEEPEVAKDTSETASIDDDAPPAYDGYSVEPRLPGWTASRGTTFKIVNKSKHLTMFVNSPTSGDVPVFAPGNMVAGKVIWTVFEPETFKELSMSFSGIMYTR